VLTSNERKKGDDAFDGLRLPEALEHYRAP
jgi:hypothetical protein